MKIQILGIRDRKINIDGYDITYSDFAKPKTLDSFDINIIDLQDELVWCNNDFSIEGVNIYKDLISIHKLIKSSVKAKIIILYPQNYNFRYNAIEYGKFKYYRKIKDMIDKILCIYENYIVAFDRIDYDIQYEISETLCNHKKIKSDFVFDTFSFDYETRAEGSDKPTTIKCNKIYLTTLDLFSNKDNLKDFFIELGLDDSKIEQPDWVKELNYFDDQQQNSLIQNNNNKIEELQQQNKQANEKLAQNSYYKSVLYESGENLVKVVFDILSKMLDYDLSNFEDKKKEDFLIKLKDVTFIGEIKGIDTNIKSKNVSQVDTHLQDYRDELEEEKNTENLKALLVINPFRNKKLEDRETVHEQQIDLAKRNNSLIILTQDLLKLFEEYINKKVSKDKIVDAFKNQVGLFDISLI